MPDRSSREFCSTACRQAFNNRRRRRGAELYDLFMSWRFERGEAEAVGVWSLLCRLAQIFKLEDDRERAGRRSWDDLGKVKARTARLAATVVCVNAAGVGRPGALR